MADWTGHGLQDALVAPRRRPVRRARPPLFDPFGIVVRHPRLCALVFAVSCFSAFMQASRGPRPLLPDLPPQAVRVGTPVWSPILKPVPAFSLETPLFPKDSLTLSARRHNPGGGREDVFAFAAPGDARGFARVVTYRTGSEARLPGTFYLEMARRASEDGFALSRLAGLPPLPSRFGPLEWAEATLSGGSGEHRCLAWRLVEDGADLRVTGWLCGGPAREVTPEAASCFADRLDLAAGESDPALRQVFAASEARHVAGCAPPRPALPLAPPGRRRPSPEASRSGPA